jgi:hypothetical protein
MVRAVSSTGELRRQVRVVHSQRSVEAGSTPTARRAGEYAARIAEAVRTAATIA